ncbi:ABC transporter permease [Bradyrhizobium hereditatis]|uniref:ABC transporter permease n=1 Tax=Bradyrhizobium hereditatis TaxID=2821405 RepID=UPI001CE30F1F|nr:ABC transporter permease subunit [Bradyrhizobium hereditatis]
MALQLSRNTIAGVVGALAFFGAWGALSRSGLVKNVILPAPSTIVQSGWSLIVDGELARHLGASLLRAAVGFVTGSVLASLLGVAMAQLPLLHETINPLVQMFRAVPSLAFVPLVIFWFGIGEASKIFLIAWGVFFPVWVNTISGCATPVRFWEERRRASARAAGATLPMSSFPVRCLSSSPDFASASPSHWSCWWPRSWPAQHSASDT